MPAKRPPHKPAKPAKLKRAPRNEIAAGANPKPKPQAKPKPAPKPKAFELAETIGPERIAKWLARAGVCSRRDAERLIEDGRVSLNGKRLDTPAIKVGPDDTVRVDGKPVIGAEVTRLWRYHKPAGLITAHRDPGGRPTVFENLPPDLGRVISVGRLDFNSEGLLLLTNDGALARGLELPAHGFARRYRARAHGRITQTELDQLKSGIEVDGVRYSEIEATLDREATGANAWITVTLHEGKNREVRRVLEAIGMKVNRLIRLTYGPFDLGLLAPGEVSEVPAKALRDVQMLIAHRASKS